MNKNSLRKGNHSPQLESLCKSEKTSQIVLKAMRKLHKYRIDVPFPLPATIELAGSHDPSQRETAWQDGREGRRGRTPVVSTGPDLVGCVRRWYQAMWWAAILPAPLFAPHVLQAWSAGTSS